MVTTLPIILCSQCPADGPDQADVVKVTGYVVTVLPTSIATLHACIHTGVNIMLVL